MGPPSVGALDPSYMFYVDADAPGVVVDNRAAVFQLAESSGGVAKSSTPIPPWRVTISA